ncbi:MAG TPA: ABC transporter ATP-binding protein [Fimbriimonadaceae bacterium]|nr:ABC transporter ATP-binding protein [Fimbriimonadaceae bacterium]HRJ96028.1 ABC transporter ATP-binding protein [Fimbriimonadaceae bacterium]
MIVLQNASRWYGQVIGLNDVTCQIGAGITALLGQNGAGKSTLMRLVTGQLKPTTGEVTVFGLRPFANIEVYRLLGYCPEIDNFYESMTGREFVVYLARLGGYGPTEARRRADRVLETVGMADRCDKRIAGYSKGMRQRIKLAQAMVHDPRVILLDEPLNGLDPVGRREYMDLLAALVDQGVAVLVSSHILYEVEQMTRSILLLHRGRLLATGDLRVIRSLIDKHPHRIRIESQEPRRVAEQLVRLPYVLSMQFDFAGGAIELECKEPERFYDELPSLVVENDLPVSGFSSPDNNLESVFRYLVGG